MKRYIIALIGFMTCMGMVANAQSIYDMYRYCNNNYYGTARTIAMGNAFTALGGDLGSIGINPAGGSVNKFSQFTITPNLSFNINRSSYNSIPGVTKPVLSGNHINPKMTLSNIAYNAVVDFGELMNGYSGAIKAINFGMIVNGTNNYLNNIFASGNNSRTSYLGYIANSASSHNIDADNLQNSYYSDNNVNWLDKLAYSTGMISTYDKDRINYIGATEQLNKDGSVITQAGPLYQKYSNESYGSKYEYQFNSSINLWNRLYIGGNLVLTSGNYYNNVTMRESAINSSDFRNTFEDKSSVDFLNATVMNKYSANISGIYAKIGIIAVPVKFLRLGLAIQTPEYGKIKESFIIKGQTHFSDSKYDGNGSTDLGQYSYNYYTPYRVNTGIALTTRYGLLSADYEISNFANMGFDESGVANKQFVLQNEMINKFYGWQKSLRLGAEIRPISSLFIRLGYNMITSPECYYKGNNGEIIDAGVYDNKYHSNMSDGEFNNWKNSLNDKVYTKSFSQAFSFGLGYSSQGSFFCDLACRLMNNPKKYTYPYDNYIQNVNSPEILTKSRLIDIVATFGWRF